MTTLLAVPNISEGADAELVSVLARSFGPGVLDVHSDPDHHRSVITLAGEPGQLARSVLDGAREVIARLDINTHEGAHPRVGVNDVAPIVYLGEHDRGAAAAEALLLADMLGTDLGVPVFLYGALGGGRTRAELRKGGPSTLAERLASGGIRPDFGPPRMHPTAGATLVAARPPLIAFNVELAAPATLEQARGIAARIREGGAEGLPGLRAIGVWLGHRSVAQVSTNVEDHRATSLADVVEAIKRHAPFAGAELVGLAPRAALEALPRDTPLRGRAAIEDALPTSD